MRAEPLREVLGVAAVPAGLAPRVPLGERLRLPAGAHVARLALERGAVHRAHVQQAERAARQRLAAARARRQLVDVRRRRPGPRLVVHEGRDVLAAEAARQEHRLGVLGRRVELPEHDVEVRPVLPQPPDVQQLPVRLDPVLDAAVLQQVLRQEAHGDQRHRLHVLRRVEVALQQLDPLGRGARQQQAVQIAELYAQLDQRFHVLGQLSVRQVLAGKRHPISDRNVVLALQNRIS